MSKEAEVLSLEEEYEFLYLQKNPDVAEAIIQGIFKSGREHYEKHGKLEGRIFQNFTGKNNVVNVSFRNEETRFCLDPWNYLEIDVIGDLKPCCNYHGLGNVKNADDLERNNLRLRELRQSLLTGDLSEKCANCHIRSMVKVEKLKQTVQESHDSETDLLLPLPMKNLRIDINEACNLRCVYCAVSQPEYIGREMTDEIFNQVIALLPNKNQKQLMVHINGHGETTYHPNWCNYAKAILNNGVKVGILSNFARKLSKEEISVMAKMDVIELSIDTIDAELLKQIRRKVSLETILCNIQLIKVEIAKQQHNPLMGISCGVYDKNTKGLIDLARFIVKSGFDHVTLWNLVQYPDVSDSISVKSICNLPEAERETAYSYARQAVELLRNNGINVYVAGDFL
jgi:radical SAM protein with 4Fe4S-binding SPASM domain